MARPGLLDQIRAYPSHVIHAAAEEAPESLHGRAGALFGEESRLRVAGSALPTGLSPALALPLSVPAQRKAYVAALKKVVGLSFAMAGVELAGSAETESGSLWADALHRLVDASVDLGSLISNSLALGHPEWRESKREMIDAGVGFSSAAIILTMAILTAAQAVERLYAPEPLMGWATMLLAFAGLGAQLGSIYFLYPHREANQSLKTAFLHAFVDALGSLGIIAASAAQLGLGWSLADPMVTLGIVGLILRTAIPRAIESGKALWAATASGPSRGSKGP
ncbi:MAG: cation transporter [Elusimicrobia bacterium]|nr:cation transporter [Elusimicrobiota bacterium]